MTMSEMQHLHIDILFKKKNKKLFAHAAVLPVFNQKTHLVLRLDYYTKTLIIHNN